MLPGSKRGDRRWTTSAEKKYHSTYLVHDGEHVVSKATSGGMSSIGDRRHVEDRPAAPVSIPADKLKIGLASWIIQDGNYGNFETGMRTEFALEFFSKNLTSLDEGAARTPSIMHIEDDQYRVVGKLVHVGAGWIVLDFGCVAYQSAVRGGTYHVGGWYKGEITISVDPFSYFERLCNQSDAPPLIYAWRIDAIEMLTAPLVEEKGGLRRRDTSKWGWKCVEKTDAWNDDDGHAEYILSCSMLSTEARSEFS
ncbi:MAG: hypothetical protein R3C60_10400 [Parvularculaceae bacterium]